MKEKTQLTCKIRANKYLILCLDSEKGDSLKLKKLVQPFVFLKDLGRNSQNFLRQIRNIFKLWDAFMK